MLSRQVSLRWAILSFHNLWAKSGTILMKMKRNLIMKRARNNSLNFMKIILSLKKRKNKKRNSDYLLQLFIYTERYGYRTWLNVVALNISVFIIMITIYRFLSNSRKDDAMLKQQKSFFQASSEASFQSSLITLNPGSKYAHNHIP